MLRGVRFSAHPTSEQKLLLAHWFGACRVVWNAKTAELGYWRTFRRHSLQHTGVPLPVDQSYSHFKTELTPWLSDVPSQILRNTASRWFTTYQRHLKGLGGSPRFKKKGERASVLLTRELFEFAERVDSRTGEPRLTLRIGTRKFPFGELSFTAHRPFEVPNSVTIVREAGRYFVAFSWEDGLGEPATDAELFEQYARLPESDLVERTVGLDRNVVAPVAASTGEVFDYTPEEKRALARLERRARRAQRRLARQKEDSRRRERTRREIATARARQANIRRDRAHKTSRRLADSEAWVFGVEDLKIQNLTARPKARCDERGRWQRNGAGAKAGLNRAILGACWGLVVTYLGYKARALGKLVLPVVAAYSSLECSRCGHIDRGNRPTQSEFVCQNGACGHRANADTDAAVIVSKRAVARLVAGDMPQIFTRGTRGCARSRHRKTSEARGPTPQGRNAVA